MVIDKVEKTLSAAKIRFAEIDSTHDDEEDVCVLDPKKNLLSVESFKTEISNFQIIEFAPRSVFNSEVDLYFNTEPQPAFNKQFDLIADKLRENEEDLTRHTSSATTRNSYSDYATFLPTSVAMSSFLQCSKP
jgi:hypothetical protein